MDLFRPAPPCVDAHHSLAANGMACYPLVPWSNRIGGGGFMHAGRIHRLTRNTPDPYPIHGDAWQQAWQLGETTSQRACMHLVSHHHLQSPYCYQATQTIELGDRQLTHALAVQNLGHTSMPFGLGLHPWFISTPQCVIHAPVQGVWLSAADRLPIQLSQVFPTGWNLNEGVQPQQVNVDNAFHAWSGSARVVWPEWHMALQLQAQCEVSHQRKDLHLVLYAPDQEAVFCVEPVSHPINAAHLPGQPGWVTLAPGERMVLHLKWQWQPIEAVAAFSGQTPVEKSPT